MKLTAKNLEKIFMDCLFRDGEDTSDPAIAEGILSTFGFHKGRLAGHKADIAAMLSDLPDDFMRSKGGGMSFLNACMTKDGEHWGGHRNMEQLFTLGLALGLVKLALPRAMWSVLPGGMPYYTVIDKEAT